jgi:hypothetical protein
LYQNRLCFHLSAKILAFTLFPDRYNFCSA